MKLHSKSKPRIVTYITSAEMDALRKAAEQSGLRTPAQVVGMWMRQKIAEVVPVR